jgi:hypothetical protein
MKFIKIFSVLLIVIILYLIMLNFNKKICQKYVFDECNFELEDKYKTKTIFGQYKINDNIYEGFVKFGKPNGKGKCKTKYYTFEGEFDNGYIFLV